MELKEIQKIIGNYLQTEDYDRMCYGCIYNEYYPVRAGAPENTPWMRCEYMDITFRCKHRYDDVRPIECILFDYKERR